MIQIRANLNWKSKYSIKKIHQNCTLLIPLSFHVTKKCNPTLSCKEGLKVKIRKKLWPSLSWESKLIPCKKICHLSTSGFATNIHSARSQKILLILVYKDWIILKHFLVCKQFHLLLSRKGFSYSIYLSHFLKRAKGRSG